MTEAIRAFVDTHIFVDYFLDRKDHLKPLGEFAFQFFKRAIGCRYVVVVCSATVEELCRILEFSESEVWRLVFSELKSKDKITIVEPSESQINEANRLRMARSVPTYDALYAVLARDTGAVLVSRDKHHAERLADITRPFAPEELQ